MITVLVSDDYLQQVTPQLLERAAQATLDQQKITQESDLTIAVDNDVRLQELNRDYLGIDAPTDVLSFPSGGEETDPDTGNPYLGDIILSYPRSAEQADSAGHAVQDEMMLLVIHGVLHLLGHDHAEPAEKAEMWGAQKAVSDQLGLKLNRLPE